MTLNICDNNDVATFSTQVLKSNSTVLKTRKDKVCLCLFLACFVMVEWCGKFANSKSYLKKIIVPFIFKDKAKQQTRIYLNDGGFINAIS